MANITMDLQDFTCLMALGLRRRRALFLDLYNAAQVKAGNDPTTVDNTPELPTNFDPTVDNAENTVATRVKTAIQAAA